MSGPDAATLNRIKKMGADPKIVRVHEIMKDTGLENPWDQAWQEGATPWDAGQIQPPLKEFFESSKGKEVLGELRPDSKALVPGCGKGYDVVYLASLGYETAGLDLSPLAVKLANESIAASSAPANALSKVSIKLADFFKFEVPEAHYDVVYDYTFFCALPPSLREPWGQRMSEIVRPGGVLVVLVFPIDGPRTNGPPYSINVEMVESVLGEGWTKSVDVIPTRTEEALQIGRERLAVWKRS